MKDFFDQFILLECNQHWFLIFTKLKSSGIFDVFHIFSVPPIHQDDLKRRHRSSQSDDSKSAKKSGNNGTGMVSGGSGLDLCPASPQPLRPVSSTPTKSTGPPQYSLRSVFQSVRSKNLLVLQQRFFENEIIPDETG